MGLKDLFGKKEEEPTLDPLADLVLHKLKVGYLVDYDLKTWQVTDYAEYDYGEGERVKEWQLEAGREKRFLEHADGTWTLARKVSIGAIDGQVREHVLEHDDPPERITYKGKEYYLDASAGGRCFPGGTGPAQELIKWEFLDEDEESFLCLEQWSETELQAAAGFFVEDYQFTNILPGGGDES